MNSVYALDSIDALRSLPKGTAEYIRTSGYYTKNDGGDAFYLLDSNDTTSTDNGSTIIVTGDGERFKMCHDGTVSLKQAGAKGDRTTDDTQAIQNVINVALASGEIDIYVPVSAGYRTTSEIDINNGLRIYGAGCKVGASGSWFYLDHTGKGFNVQSSQQISEIRFNNIGTARNQPPPDDRVEDYSPVVCDYDFYISGSTDVTLEDIIMLNPYQGVIATGNSGRFIVNRMRGQPLFRGIVIDTAEDTCRVSNVHFWPFWSQDQKVWDFQLDNLQAYVSLRNDNPFYENIFSIFHNIGFFISANAQGTTYKFKIVNADLDRCSNGFVIDSTVTGATGQIINFSSQGELGRTEDNVGINIKGTNCEVDIVNVDLRVFNANGILISGTGNSVSVCSAKIANFNQSGSGFPAMEAAANNTLDVTGKARIDTSGPLYGGDGTITAKLGEGCFSGTTDANGLITVTHGLGIQPRRVMITEYVDGGCFAKPVSITDSVIQIRFFTSSSGEPLANQSVSGAWSASF